VTVPVVGKYKISTSVLQQGTGTGTVYMMLKDLVSGATYRLFQNNSIASGVVVGYSTTMDFKAGDTFDIRIYSSLTSPSIYGDTSLQISQLNIEKLSGPSQIMASDTIAARYYTAAGQSISNASATIVDYGTKSFDNTGSVTTGAAWKFTAQSSGTFLVIGRNAFTSNITGERYFDLYKNGAIYCRLDARSAVTIGVPTHMSGSVEIKLIAGDYIDIRVYQSSGGALTLHAELQSNYIDIIRTGNY